MRFVLLNRYKSFVERELWKEKTSVSSSYEPAEKTITPSPSGMGPTAHLARKKPHNLAHEPKESKVTKQESRKRQENRNPIAQKTKETLSKS